MIPMTGWSEWHPVYQTPKHDGAAVYKTRATLSKKPIEIHRIAGTDSEGILFFGQTKNIEQRISDLSRAIRTGSGPHSEGLVFHTFRDIYKKRFGKRPEVEFSFQRAKNENQAKRLEARCLEMYMRRFGEPPPLNSSIPWGAWKPWWQDK